VSLEEVKARLARAALLLDFDGTLSPIVVRPEEARPVAGAEEVLAGLVERAGSVTIVTGRRSAFIRSVLPVDGLEVIGQFGMEGSPPMPAEVLAEVNAKVTDEPGVRVVDKGASIAVHVRTAPDPDAATARISGPLAAIAERYGLDPGNGSWSSPGRGATRGRSPPGSSPAPAPRRRSTRATTSATCSRSMRCGTSPRVASRSVASRWSARRRRRS
jgi:hypothetical protein